VRDDIKHVGSEQRQGKVDEWLSPPDPSANYNKALRQRHEGSGMWFLQSDAFKDWTKKQNSFLWLHGLPGGGKTILSSTIIEQLKTTVPLLLYFYFDFGDERKQTLEGMIRSLVTQISYQHEQAAQQLDSLFSSCKDGREQPTMESLCKILIHSIRQVEEVFIVLDALDECRTREGALKEELLSWIKEILQLEESNVHLLVTSRQEQYIESRIKKFARSDDVKSIESDDTTKDIRAYVRARVTGNGFKRWEKRPNIQQEVETRLMEKAGGMFRWAACQLDVLERCLDYGMLKTALASLPPTLGETYARILREIPLEYKRNATRILQFLVYSKRPLMLEEAVDAIAVETEGNSYFDPNYRMPEPSEILCYCSSLVALVPINDHSSDQNDNHMELRLAHLSVKEYLTSNRLQEDIAPNFREITARASIATICLAYLLHLDVQIPTWEIRKKLP